MRAIPLDDIAPLFEGALGTITRPGYIRPWRLPPADHRLHDPGLLWMAGLPAGVRLRFVTDSPTVVLEVDHVMPEGFGLPVAYYDLVVGGEVRQRAAAPDARMRIEFADVPPGEPVEIWLPHFVGVRLRAVEIADGTALAPVDDDRHRWVTYGSSITHCMEAAGPTDTWPAVAAARLDWHLTCLGFGGMCHLDPLVARAMAALPADRFSLKVGINVHNMASARERVFGPLVHGFLATLRDAHPTTPITVISPILSPDREQSARSVLALGEGPEVVLEGDLTLERMRDVLQSVVGLWQDRGDTAIDYLDGRELFGPDDLDHLPDGLHPDGVGYARMGERFAARFA